MNSRSTAVPSDWQVKTLAELGAQVTSGSRGWAAHYADYGSLFVRITNLDRSNIHLDLSNSRFVQIDPNDAEARRTRLATGDLLVSITADIGVIGYIDDNVPRPAYINQHIARVRLDRRLVDSRFVAYYLASWEPQRRFVGSTDIGAKAGMNLNTVAMLSTVVPPLAEQSRIADALTDVDNLIATAERMIAKKQAIKQGAIQQLLTGRIRLLGYKGAWEHRSVTRMGEVLAGKALNANGSGVLRPYLRTKNVLDGRIDLKDVLRMPMTDSEFNRFRIKQGDVLLNEGQSLELVGRCSIYDDELAGPYAMQNQLLRFRAHAQTSPEFAAHLFRHCQKSGVFSSIATKTTSVAHLGSSRLSNLRLLWPIDRDEQVAITEVLSDMDNEISAYRVRLDKARALRQGMMQQLLTGRTRL